MLLVVMAEAAVGAAMVKELAEVDWPDILGTM